MMKKKWKIIIGILLIIGGLGSIDKGIGTVLLDIIIGAIFIAWWIFEQKKNVQSQTSLTIPKNATSPTKSDLISKQLPKVKTMTMLRKKDGATLAYSFQPIAYIASKDADISSVFANEEKPVDAFSKGSIVELRYNDILFGIVESEKISGMIND